jgi:hypothetical protein
LAGRQRKGVARRRGMAVLLALALAVTPAFAATGCKAGGGKDGSGSDASTSSVAGRGSSAAKLPADIGKHLPYKGMPESAMNKTGLGPYTDMVTTPHRGDHRPMNTYRWFAHNGTGDLVFFTYCLDGKVLDAIKNPPSVFQNYWVEGQELPNLDASGAYPNGTIGQTIDMSLPSGSSSGSSGSGGGSGSNSGSGSQTQAQPQTQSQGQTGQSQGTGHLDPQQYDTPEDYADAERQHSGMDWDEAYNRWLDYNE